MPGLIGLRTSTALRHKRIALTTPGDPVPDGDGGYIETPIPLDPPEVYGYVQPASARDLERLAAGTVISQATHLVYVPYHPEITTETELSVENYPRPARRFGVIAVVNPDERNAELVLLCAEVVE